MGPLKLVNTTTKNSNTSKYMQCMLEPNNLNIGEFTSIPTPQRSNSSAQSHFEFGFEINQATVWYLSVSFMKSKLFPAQIGRMLYFIGQGDFLVGIVCEELMQFILVPCNRTRRFDIDENVLHSMKQVHGVNFVVSTAVNENLSTSLAKICVFSLKCEMVRSSQWISIGKCMDLLTTSDVLKSESGQETRNIPVIKLLSGKGASVDAEFAVYKYYPLKSKTIKEEITGSHVCVLPNLTDATVLDVNLNCLDDSVMFLKTYWFHNHGVSIPEESLRNQVRVSFHGSSMELTYPAVCLWKHSWCYLPRHTIEYGNSIANRFASDLRTAVELWNIPKISLECDAYRQLQDVKNGSVSKRMKLT